jgi:hypothetical protein
MAKGTLSRRTANGWEVIKRIENVEDRSPLTKTDIYIPISPGRKKLSKYVIFPALVMAAAGTILAFYCLFRSESINPVRYAGSLPAPVAGQSTYENKTVFFTRTGRAYAFTVNGLISEPELDFNLLDDEILIWINRASDLFITKRQENLLVYKLIAGGDVVKLAELAHFSPPVDDSGLLIRGRELLSPDLSRHEKINTEDNLISGQCRFDLCILEAESQIFLKRSAEATWTAFSSIRNDSAPVERVSLITSSVSVLSSSGASLDLYEFQNSQWQKTKQWNKDTTPVLADSAIVWIGRKSPVADPSIIIKILSSGQLKYVDLGSGASENLDGVKTSLSKFIWLNNNLLNFFDKDGNLYQHQISTKEARK